MLESETSAADIGRAIWLKERRSGIGGSDVAAILGISPYGTPLSVWLDKTNRKPLEHAPTEPQWWGSALEDVIARRYTEKTGNAVWKPDRLMMHPEFPVIIGTPDRLVIGKRRGVEIKTASMHLADQWGIEGTDQIPHHYAVQCVIYMAVTGFPVWDVVVLIGGNDCRVYTIVRDLDVEARMLERLIRWWNLYVVGDVAPPAQAGDQHALELMYPEWKRDELIEANTSDELLSTLIFAEMDHLSATEEKLDHAKNMMRQRIGDAVGIAGDGWKMTWKQTAPRKSTDYQQVAALLAKALEREIGYEAAARIHNAAIEQALVEKPGVRTFRTSRKGGS